jgi:hypothetical protein
MEHVQSVEPKRIRQLTEAIVHTEDLMLHINDEEVRGYLESAAMRLRAARLVMLSNRRRRAA